MGMDTTGAAAAANQFVPRTTTFNDGPVAWRDSTCEETGNLFASFELVALPGYPVTINVGGIEATVLELGNEFGCPLIRIAGATGPDGKVTCVTHEMVETFGS